MSLEVKALIVVLALSGLVFALGRGSALKFTDEADFKRRRNAWLILSAAAFLSPDVWLFALVAAPVLYWGGRKDSNPLAFYLLLMSVIPSVAIQIPTDGLGIKQLFSIDIFRLLSLCVLLPAAWRIHKARDPERIRGLQRMDLLLIGYGILKVALYVPPDMPNHVILETSFTNVLREAFLFVLDIYALYYVASRSCSSRRAIVDAMAAFCLSCTVMAAVAVFESLKHWHLYSTLYTSWGGQLMDTEYLFRAGVLRAEASSGNPLVLAYLLAIAFGFWLYLGSHLERRAPRMAVTALLWVALLATASRGPWLGALLIYFSYAAFSPGGRSRLLRSVLVFVIVAGVTLASPVGDKITKSLPFLGGKVTDNSIIYREQLLERSWQLFQAHPFLGDQLALSQMQDLRQGQGIIDLVNAYVGVALFYGLVGLTIFLAIILLSMSKAYGVAKMARQSDPDGSLLGASLTACMLGTLLMLANCSFILGYATIFFVLAGLAAAYSRLSESAQVEMAMSPSAARSPEPR